MSNAYIGLQQDDDQILTICCEMDGHPDQLGRILLEHYKDVNHIRRLIELGRIEEVHGPDLLKDVTVCEQDEDSAPILYEDMEWCSLSNYHGIDYLYLFSIKENGWLVTYHPDPKDKFHVVEKPLADLFDVPPAVPVLGEIQLRLDQISMTVSENTFFSLCSQLLGVIQDRPTPLALGNEVIWWQHGKPKRRLLFLKVENDGFLMLDAAHGVFTRVPKNWLLQATGRCYGSVAQHCLNMGAENHRNFDLSGWTTREEAL